MKNTIISRKYIIRKATPYREFTNNLLYYNNTLSFTFEGV